MGSGLPRHVPASAHDWRHVLTFQGKSGSVFFGSFNIWCASCSELADILAEINQVTFVHKKHPDIFELSGCFILQSLLQASIPLPVGR